MSNASKPRKTPTLTRNGKVRFYGFSISKLQELIEKSNRKRDTNKFKNRINVLIKRGL